VLTQSFADAVAEAEKIIASAPHVRTEADLAEGYDYLAGNIRASDRDRVGMQSRRAGVGRLVAGVPRRGDRA
jgi:hypothetical protein